MPEIVAYRYADGASLGPAILYLGPSHRIASPTSIYLLRYHSPPLHSPLLHPTLHSVQDIVIIMGGRTNPEAEPKKDQDLEALKEARIPLAYRDKCGHLLVDLNKCRRSNLFSPNQCGHERHTYEECEYYAWMDRVHIKEAQVKAQK